MEANLIIVNDSCSRVIYSKLCPRFVKVLEDHLFRKADLPDGNGRVNPVSPSEPALQSAILHMYSPLLMSNKLLRCTGGPKGDGVDSIVITSKPCESNRHLTTAIANTTTTLFGTLGNLGREIVIFVCYQDRETSGHLFRAVMDALKATCGFNVDVLRHADSDYSCFRATFDRWMDAFLERCLSKPESVALAALEVLPLADSATTSSQETFGRLKTVVKKLDVNVWSKSVKAVAAYVFVGGRLLVPYRDPQVLVTCEAATVTGGAVYGRQDGGLESLLAVDDQIKVKPSGLVADLARFHTDNANAKDSSAAHIIFCDVGKFRSVPHVLHIRKMGNDSVPWVVCLLLRPTSERLIEFVVGLPSTLDVLEATIEELENRGHNLHESDAWLVDTLPGLVKGLVTLAASPNKYMSNFWKTINESIVDIEKVQRRLISDWVSAVEPAQALLRPLKACWEALMAIYSSLVQNPKVVESFVENVNPLFKEIGHVLKPITASSLVVDESKAEEIVRRLLEYLPGAAAKIQSPVLYTLVNRSHNAIVIQGRRSLAPGNLERIGGSLLGTHLELQQMASDFFRPKKTNGASSPSVLVRQLPFRLGPGATSGVATLYAWSEDSKGNLMNSSGFRRSKDLELYVICEQGA